MIGVNKKCMNEILSMRIICSWSYGNSIYP